MQNVQVFFPPKNYFIITSKVWRSSPWLGWPLCNICVTNDHGYVPLLVNTSRSFPHSWLIIGFVTRLTRRVPLVEQELPTPPEHLSLPPFLWGSCYSFFSFMCMVCRSLFVFLYLFFLPLCSLIYEFWLPLWYLQTLLIDCNIYT